MSKKIFFTPGPSELYFTVEQHLKTALLEGVPSISHRSEAFKKIFSEAVSNLRALLQLPDNYHIAFTASATEIWERLIQNLVDENTFHFVNGSFSARFYKVCEELGRKPQRETANLGECPSVQGVHIPAETELISVTHNETSTGVSFPIEDIYQLRERNKEAILVVDAVSSLPYVNLDYNKIDSAYFSVQKCFGLPAGLGVWIYNDRCLEVANERADRGKSIGSYHSLPSLHKKALVNQTPETPNVLNIYLLAKVSGDMLIKGIDRIRFETEQKAAILYNFLDQNTASELFVKIPEHRSKTVIVAKTLNSSSSDLISKLKEKGLVVGSGYGNFKNEHIRVSNFPTHSKEQIELLIDTIEDLF